MRIAVFHNLPPGGAKRVADKQVEYLLKKHGVKVFKLRFKPKGSRLKRDFDNFVTLAQKHRQLAAKIDRANFDVCLVHLDPSTQAPFLLRFLKTPSVYYCMELLRIAHEPELAFDEPVGLLKRLYENLTRQIRKQIDASNAKKATKMIAISRFIQRKIKKVYGRNSIVCHPGVDTKVFQPARLPRRKQVVFVGEKNEINGYSLAKEAARLAGVKLKVIAGMKLTDKQLAKEYSQSIATLCTSINEPFGLVSLESMACGTPVLAVNEGGYKETVVDGKTGYLLPRDPVVFAEKIRNFADHPREVSLRNFSWQSHCWILGGELSRFVKKSLVKLVRFENDS